MTRLFWSGGIQGPCCMGMLGVGPHDADCANRSPTEAAIFERAVMRAGIESCVPTFDAPPRPLFVSPQLLGAVQKAEAAIVERGGYVSSEVMRSLLPLVKEAVKAADAAGDKVRPEDIRLTDEAMAMWARAPRLEKCVSVIPQDAAGYGPSCSCAAHREQGAYAACSRCTPEVG